MKSLPSRRFSRFGVSRSAGRTRVSVTAAADTAVSASQSSVTAFPVTIANDGVATSTITVTVLNAAGTPLSGKTVTPAATGTDNTFTPASGETDGNGQVEFAFSTTTAEAKTISATAESVAITDTATVTASAAPSLDWYSLFATTGTNATARGDSGKWNTFTGNTPGCEVIAATGLDFPTTNVLEVREHTTPIRDKVLRKTGLTVPSVGSTRYYRCYLRIDSDVAAAVTDLETHPIQDGISAGNINWGWWVYHATGGAGKWTLNFQQGAVNGYPNYIWPLSTTLDHDTTYRLEWSIERTGATTFKAAVRVYNSAGTLLYSSSDFRNATSSTDLATYMASNDFTFFNVANMDGLNAGSNGLGGTELEGPTGLVYSYQGGFATGIDCGWIGAFNGSNET